MQAFTDVDTALTGWRYASEQERLQRIAVEAATRAATIATAQLGAGTVDITTCSDGGDDPVQRRRYAGSGPADASAGFAQSIQSIRRGLGGGGSAGGGAVSGVEARDGAGRGGFARGRERGVSGVGQRTLRIHRHGPGRIWQNPAGDHRRRKCGAALAVGDCILPEPACAGGRRIPKPRLRQSQLPRELLMAQGMTCLTHRAAPHL